MDLCSAIMIVAYLRIRRNSLMICQIGKMAIIDY